MDHAAANTALNFEAWAYGAIVRKPDTAEQFRASYALLTPPLIEAALPYVEQIPMPDHTPPRVGFCMPSSGVLAHTVNLQTLLSGLKHLSDKPIEPYVYTLDKSRPPFEEAFAGWPVRHCGRGTQVDSWLKLREKSKADGLSAMVFVSMVQGLAFGSTMGIAPRHIWWAHKWHGFESPGLHGYLDACHPFHEEIEIDGRMWRSTYTALPELFDPTKTEAAKAIRATCKAKTLFGWMGRAEKLTLDYADAVAEILKRVPDSGYVYTGRADPIEFTARLAAHGVGDRCQHIGWVDTRLWAQIIDVYLDTFPFQSGHTAYEVMAAGKPVVWLHDDAMAEEQSASGLIRATWDMGALTCFGGWQPWVNDVAGYVSRACELAECGGMYGYREFIHQFMRDEKRMAQSVSTAILEVINGKPRCGEGRRVLPPVREAGEGGGVQQHLAGQVPGAISKPSARGKAASRRSRPARLKGAEVRVD